MILETANLFINQTEMTRKFCGCPMVTPDLSLLMPSWRHAQHGVRLEESCWLPDLLNIPPLVKHAHFRCAREGMAAKQMLVAVGEKHVVLDFTVNFRVATNNIGQRRCPNLIQLLTVKDVFIPEAIAVANA